MTITFWALFWIELYFSWLIIEYIARRYDMIKNNKMQIMGITGLTLFGVFIACASPEDPNKAIEDAKALHREEARQYNESRAEGWKEYLQAQEPTDESTRDSRDTSMTMEEILREHVIDSTKIIAIKYPDDAFTDFEEAFMTARYELGKNKHFIWMKKLYSTNYKEEGYSGEFTR
tara:strand:- start:69 stop:593 length:525 start_codon:yes stop_codon:yes gene_type:complete